MGVRAAVVVCATSFLLGSLFTHWIADSLTLWKQPVTNEHLWIAATYYSILTKSPREMLYFLAAVVFTGAVALVWSLRDGEAGNLMFDGASIFLYFTTVAMHTYSVLPNVMSLFAVLPTHRLQDQFPPSLRAPTLELASNHLISSVALTGVLALQAGRLWVEQAEGEEEEDADGTESEPRTATPTPAPDQAIEEGIVD